MPSYRDLPGVERVLAELRAGDANLPHAVLLEAAREAIGEARAAIASGDVSPAPGAIAERARQLADAAARPSLVPVINASGVLLQTNLGRAPLSERAIAAVQAVARDASNLEFDLDEGQRGSRHEHVRGLIRRATGAADGIALNNNAAALFMVLQVFAAGREVIVSRGQAVEIGGGFRIPDVLRQSGARLVEVGTTNRTYARDYADAITPDTAAILRVHTSNFRVVGFTHEPGASELAAVAKEHGVLLLDDLGSGCLLDTTRFGMAREPTVQASLAAGANLALFSGDKLLGGPQCGIVAGDAELVASLRAHPLARALRLDKLAIAALEATLLAYVLERAEDEIPLWRMLAMPATRVRRRAARWARAAGPTAHVIPGTTMVGGGSLPGEGVPTWCVAMAAEHPAALARSLRGGSPPLIGRVESRHVILDPRTVDPRHDAIVGRLLANAVAPDSR